MIWTSDLSLTEGPWAHSFLSELSVVIGKMWFTTPIAEGYCEVLLCVISETLQNLNLENVRFKGRCTHVEAWTSLGVITWQKKTTVVAETTCGHQGSLLWTLNLKFLLVWQLPFGLVKECSPSATTSLSWASHIPIRELLSMLFSIESRHHGEVNRPICGNI